MEKKRALRLDSFSGIQFDEWAAREREKDVFSCVLLAPYPLAERRVRCGRRANSGRFFLRYFCFVVTVRLFMTSFLSQFLFFEAERTPLRVMGCGGDEMGRYAGRGY